MNEWQSWIVALLIGLCVFRMLSGLYSVFLRIRSHDKDKKNHCTGCSCGCNCSQVSKRSIKEEKNMADNIGIYKKCTTFAPQSENENAN